MQAQVQALSENLLKMSAIRNKEFNYFSSLQLILRNFRKEQVHWSVVNILTRFCIIDGHSLDLRSLYSFTDVTGVQKKRKGTELPVT
jgi:hypothetical protein